MLLGILSPFPTSCMHIYIKMVPDQHLPVGQSFSCILDSPFNMSSDKIDLESKDGVATPVVGEVIHDSDIYIDPVAEAKALRKCDMVLIPLFTISFMSAYLDRSNIGNAQTAGLLTDLHMSTQSYASEFNNFPEMAETY